MNDTEKAALEKRIDELCQENERLREQGARLFDKTLELGTENAKLREQLEYNRQTSRSRLERIDQLKDENAKLRELVAELWALADGYTPDDSELDTARDLMRELGIEVPS